MEQHSAENMSPRVSHIRPPSKIPAVLGRSLNEVSNSDGNVRAQHTMMAPPLPSGGATKHRPSNLPEPPTKRKTLIERAGEVSRPNPAAPPSFRQVNGTVRAMAAAGIKGHSLHPPSTSNRTGSSASNISSGYGSINSRNTSGSSLFNGSVGAGEFEASLKTTATYPSGSSRPLAGNVSRRSSANHERRNLEGDRGRSRPNSSISNNVEDSRPPSAQPSLRPNSAISHSRSAYHKARADARPPSVNEHFAGVNDSISRKQMGPPNVSTIPAESPILVPRRQRRRKDAQSDPSSDQGLLNCAKIPNNPFRAVSITTAMQTLTLKGKPTVSGGDTCPETPSYIPKPVPPRLVSAPSRYSSPMPSVTRPLRSTSPSKSLAKPQYLNRFTNTLAAWDPSSRFQEIEQSMKQLYGMNERMEQSLTVRNTLEEQVNLQKTRIHELELIRSDISATKERLQARVDSLQDSNTTLQISNTTLQSKLDDAREQYHNTKRDLDERSWSLQAEIEDINRRYRNETERLNDELQQQGQKSRREAEEETSSMGRRHKEEMAEFETKMRTEVEEQRKLRNSEINQMSQALATLEQNSQQEGASKESEIQNLKSDLCRFRADVQMERSLNEGLKAKLVEATATNAGLQSSIGAMRGKIEFLESDTQAQSQEFANLKRREQEAIAIAEDANAKLRAEESLRRKLHNQVQELKGNIRVFCRVRPTMEAETIDAAKISYPDDADESKDIMILGPEQKSALGNITTSKHGFSFDRVFGPSSSNTTIFEEISQLVQSALDGYNVCIFCYGQTGSGKTYTMSSSDGMIPLAVDQIYQTATMLKDKGWEYTMEGTFVEVYNESLNDLLGRSEDLDKKKLEIRHDDTNCKTTITDVTSITLDSPDMLQSLLNRASKNRSVAATKANERSSRSHSVFMLRLKGSNSITGERSEGTLNLVDLAGSERISHSGATGERLKETQNINRSLSCLGDVIAALGQSGQGKEDKHIPYRNSKLTYLLRHSLGGNSKTLMFVMVSPLQAHLQETITSLKFATKVHNTHIGTARKQSKVRD